MRRPWQVDALFRPRRPLGQTDDRAGGRQVAWLAASLIIVSGCGVAAALLYLRDEAMRSAEQLNQSLVQVIEEQTSRTFQTVDQRLQLAASRLQALRAESRLNEDSARAMLRAELTDLPFVRAIWVLDAQGSIAFDSDIGNLGIRLADREYFQVYQQRPGTGFHVSAPVRSRSTGTWLISAARPLPTENGEPTGVIVAAVEPPYFVGLWRKLELGQDGAVALFRRDGVLMLRSPAVEESMGKTFSELSLFTDLLPKSPQGSYQISSVFDARVRSLAYRTLSTYPDLVVNVGRSRDDILGPWSRFAALSVAIWLAAALVVVALSILLYRQSRRYLSTEVRFRQLAQAMPQIVFIADARGRLVFVSDQWTAMTGQPVEAALHGRWFDRIHPEDRPSTTAVMQRTRVSGESVPTDYRLLCADGNYRWQLARAVANRDRHGNILSWYGTSTDIDTLKQTEAALKIQTDLMRMAGHIARMGGWALDVPTMQFLWSEEASAVLGLPAGSAPTLESAIALCKPAWREMAARAAQACLTEGTPFEVELEMTTAAGQDIWVRSMGQALRNEQGTIVRMQGALQDITSRVTAEQEVENYLKTLQRLADAAQAITQHQTLDAMMQEVAEQARAIIGAHQSAVSLLDPGGLAAGWNRALTARSLSGKYAAYRSLTEKSDGSGIYAMVCETNRPYRMTQAELLAHPRWRGFGGYAGKHPVMRGWLAVPLINRQGANIGLLHLSDKFEGEFSQRDEYVATELAQLTAVAVDNVKLLAQVKDLNSGLEEKVLQRTLALSRQEALFRTLTEQAPQPIWTVDERGSATFFSRAWYDLVGGAPPDWLGYGWLDLVHPDDVPAASQNWLHAVKTRTLFAGTRRLRARDGSYHTMSYRASPVVNAHDDVIFWVGIDADITEVKAIETALRLSNAELEAFSYSVSHDLRAPLNTVDGFSRLLLKELNGAHSPKVAHYLSRVQAGVGQMSQLIEGLLSLAHVARLELRRDAVDLSAFSLDILERLQAGERERRVVWRVEPALVVHGDSRLLRAVMENLLGNAWKFSARCAEADIVVGRDATSAAFFVRDNGAGFDMAYADKLFGTFQRLHDVSEYAGTGIGLATVARVISRHGGRIWAESAPDQGATFFFTLPDAPR